MEIRIEGTTYKGTRILFKKSAKSKRDLLNNIMDIMYLYGYEEIMIPVIQMASTFASKVGEENNNMMYKFTDKGERDLCLAPEYTAVVQKMTDDLFKYTKDVKMFYIGECFRGENPQKGRFRQFTQFGVEVLNPSKDYSSEMIELASKIIELVTDNYEVNSSVTRGLDYYKEGLGFEISCPDLGTSKQICGGGAYEGGIGFAIGIDRLLCLTSKQNTNFWDEVNKKWIFQGDSYRYNGEIMSVVKKDNNFFLKTNSGLIPLTNFFEANYSNKLEYIGNNIH